LVPLEERITRHRALASTLTAVARHLRESPEKLDAVVITGDITYACAFGKGARAEAAAIRAEASSAFSFALAPM